MVTRDDARRMTKTQVLKALVALGVTDIIPDGRYDVWGNIGGRRCLFDPRDMLVELSQSASSRPLTGE